MASIPYQRLGKKTFLLFFLKKSGVLFILFGLLSIGIFIESKLTTQEGLIKALKGFNWLVFYIFTSAFLGILIITWLKYSTYLFALDEHAFRVKYGILNKREITLPYRQIQNVNIERDVSYRILGLSKLGILTAGTEDKDKVGESEGILPALDQKLASYIQAELLKRANIERITPA